MKSGIARNAENERGWIFYDADCAFCRGLACRLERALWRRGFRILPLQTPGSEERLGVSSTDLFSEMYLLTSEGRRFGGADAVVEIAQRTWWAWPLAATARIPGTMPLLRRLYARVAANRACHRGSCQIQRPLSAWDWLPVLLLPALVFLVQNQLDRWVFMWLMALALFAGCKWLTYRAALKRGINLSVGQTLIYLVAWVGMEPAAFAEQSRVHPAKRAHLAHPADRTERSKDESRRCPTASRSPSAGCRWLGPGKSRPPCPTESSWLGGLMKTFVGAALVWGGVRLLEPPAPLLSGWVGMFGIILMLHFGLFQLLALAWRGAGVPVMPLMREPLRATSLGEFWNARWNTGFHALAREFLFRPMVHRLGGGIALVVAFLVSGLVHELVISLPAQGGFGLPTMYFLLQGLGLLVERSALGRRTGLGEGPRGRTFAIAVVAGPAFWLFPPVFVHNVILPMLRTLGAA